MFQIQTNWSYPTSYTKKLRCIFALCFLWNIEERNRSFANTLHGTCAQGRCIFNSLVLRIPTFYRNFECWCGSELRVWKFLNNIYLLFCWSILFHYLLLCEVIEDSWKLYVRDIPKEISWSSDHKSRCFEKFHWWYVIFSERVGWWIQFSIFLWTFENQI